jgi:hypothetical protein
LDPHECAPCALLIAQEIKMSVNSRRKAQLKRNPTPWAAAPDSETGQLTAAINVPAKPILQEFFSKQALAEELGRNPRTLDRWDTLGMGPPRTHVGRKVLYRRASVQRWLAAQESQGQHHANAR